MEQIRSNYPEYRVIENPHPDLITVGVRLQNLARRHHLLQRDYHRGAIKDEVDFMKRFGKLVERRDKVIFKAAEMVTESIGGFGLCAAEDIIKTVELGEPIRQTQVDSFLRNTGIKDYFAKVN